MAYYSALVAAWNSATQPPSGVTGTALTGLTTAQKIAAINAWTITGSVPTSFFVSGSQVANCINWTEFAALAEQQQSNVLTLCNQPGQLQSGSAVLSKLLPGMLIAYFPGAGPTIAALTALAQATVQNWWSYAGYTSPIGPADLTSPGVLALNGGVALT